MSGPKPAPDPIYTLRGTGSPVTYLKFSGSSRDTLYSGSQDGFVHVWDMKLKRIKTKINAHHGQSVLWINLLDDGRMLTHGRDGFVRFWSSDNSEWQNSGNIKCNSLGFCPSALVNMNTGNLLAVPGETTSTVNLYDTNNFSLVGTLRQDMTKHGMVMCMKAARNVPRLLIGYEDGSIALWDICSLNRISIERFYNDSVICLDFDAAVKSGVCASGDDKICSYTFSSTDQLEKSFLITTTNPGFNELCIRDDQKIFAAAGWDKNIRIFGMKKFKPLAVLSYHKESVQCLTFSSDHILACGSKDQHISLWQIY